MILLIIIFAVLLYIAEKYSLEHVLDRVTFQTALDRVVAEPGETFSWSITIRNGKRMTVPYLRLQEGIPENLAFADSGEPVDEKRFPSLVSTLCLGRKQKTSLSRDVMLKKRGRYFFRGAQVEAGDFLGIRSVTESYPELQEIIVKPARSESSELSELLGGYLGEHSVKKSLLEDPVSIIGFRDYTGQEPFRSISWIQSARQNRLIVKQYDHTAECSCTILLNVDSRLVRNYDTRLEQCFSIVRSICEELEKRKISCDFRTNGCIAGAMGDWNHIREGMGPSHLEAVLEGLGRMTYDSRESSEVFLEREIRGARHGKSIILVSPMDNETIRTAAKRLELVSQREVLLLFADSMEKKETAKDSPAN